MHHSGSSSTSVRGRGAPGISFEIFDSESRMSQHAAEIISEAVRQRPNLLLCAATGQTPTKTYQELATRYQADPGSFKRLHILKLDEWGGIEIDNPATCEQYLRDRVLEPLEVSEDRYVGFESNPGTPRAECRRIRDWISQHGPIDLCVLGLGSNGHIALNEPGDMLSPFSHIAELSSHSLQHPMLRASREQPGYGLTLGMAEIMQARQILLLVSGARKQKVLNRLRTCNVSTRFPASFLWLHPQVLCLCDSEAAGNFGSPEE